MGRAEAQSRGEIRDEEDIFEQAGDDGCDAFVGFDAVEGPGDGTVREGFDLGGLGVADERLRQDGGES